MIVRLFSNKRNVNNDAGYCPAGVRRRLRVLHADYSDGRQRLEFAERHMPWLKKWISENQIQRIIHILLCWALIRPKEEDK